MGKELGTTRSYSRSPKGDVVEIFTDGRPMLVERPHRGFSIAHMIGARGERPGKFTMIPWASAWEGEVAQQKAVSAYLKARPAIPGPPPPPIPFIAEPNYDSTPLFGEQTPGFAETEQRHRGRRLERRQLNARRAGSVGYRSRPRTEAIEDSRLSYHSRASFEDSQERQGRIEDMMSALRSTESFSSESELRKRAELIVSSR